MSNSVFFCSHWTKERDDPRAMSKRQIKEKQQQMGEDERVVAKSRLARNLVSVTPNQSPTMPCSSSSHSPVNLRANCSALDSLNMGKLVAMDSNENSVSSSQVWHTDSVPNPSTGKPVAFRKNTIGQNLIPRNLFDHFATQCRIYGQSIRKHATETWSSKG